MNCALAILLPIFSLGTMHRAHYILFTFWAVILIYYITNNYILKAY